MSFPLLSDPTPTPGPWKYAGWDAVGCDVYRNGDAPAECDKVAAVAREADADLICRAVNCHAGLLAACELALGLEPYLDPATYDGHASHAMTALARAVKHARGN